MNSTDNLKAKIERIPNSVDGDGRNFAAQLKRFLQGLRSDIEDKIAGIGEGAVEQVINLQLTEEHATDSNGMPKNNIRVEFDNTNVSNYLQAQIWMKEGNAGSTKPYRMVGSTNKVVYVIESVKKDVTYTVKVVACNRNSGTSKFDEAPTATITIKGSVLIPATPTQLVLTWDKDGPLWEWEHDDSGYTDYYELRLDGNAGVWDNNLLDVTRNKKSRENPGVRSGTGYLFARNIFGDYSLPATHDFNKVVAAKPTAAVLSKVLEGVNIEMAALPAGYHEYHLLINSEKFTSKNRNFVYYLFSGAIDVKYCFVDEIGEGEWSDVTSNCVEYLIDSGDIQNGAINTLKLADETVTAAKLVNAAVTEIKLATNAVTTNKLANGAVGESKIATNAVTSVKIAAGSVIADKIAANAVVGAKIAAGAVVSDKIAANAVIADKIAANAVTSDKIYANSVTTAKIATNAVDATKIAANAVTADKINAGAVTTVKLAANAVTAEKIKAASIIADHISANAVTTAKIAAGAVDAQRLSANAVTADKINAGAVTTVKLAAGAVTTDKMTIGSASGARMTLSPNLLQVYDSNNHLRVRLGVW